MQLSKNTVTILKNFAAINPGIVIFPGSSLRTVSIDKTVVAEATIEETFDREVPLYNVNEFLSVLGLFKNPDLTFTDDHVLLVEGKSRQKYYYSNKGNIEHKTTNMPQLEYNVSVDLSREELDRLTRAMSVNGATHYVFMNDKDSNIKVCAAEVDIQSGELKRKTGVFELDFVDVKHNKNFNFFVDKNIFKIIDQNYTAFLYFKDGKKLVHLESDVVKYWCAVESYSTAEE